MDITLLILQNIMSALLCIVLLLMIVIDRRGK